MRAVNLRRGNEGLARQKQDAEKAPVRIKRTGAVRTGNHHREVGPSAAPPFPYKTRRQEDRPDSDHKGHAPEGREHGPAFSC